MAYSADTFVADEQPTTAKWNKLWSNDASFNDGTGIADDKILTRHILDSNVTSDKLSLDYVSNDLAATYTTPASSAWHDTGFDVTLATAGTWLYMAVLRSNSGAASEYVVFRLYNETTATVETNSMRIGGFNTAGGIQTSTPLIKVITTTTANNVIRVEAKPGGAYSVGLLTDANGGHSEIEALRIA